VLLLAGFGALRLVLPNRVASPVRPVSAAPPVPATGGTSASDPSRSASTRGPVDLASDPLEVAPAVQSAPAPRFDEHAERLSLEDGLEPVLGEDESNVAIAEPLRVEERLAAQEAREAALEAALPAAPAPAAPPRRSEVLAQPSPRRDLAAPRPSSALEAEFGIDAETSSDSVPIARRDRANRPTPAATPLRDESGSVPHGELVAPSVTGTVWHPESARRSAQLRVAGDDRIRDVREGDRISGWQVIRIDPSGVLLRRGEVERLRRVGERS
jgi:hypothetical protein